MNVPRFILPLLIAGVLFGGYWLRFAFTQPTTSEVFEQAGSTPTKQVVCTVEGVKCKGTAAFFSRLFDDVEGISGIETIASEHLATINYDPQRITPDRIKEIIEQQVPLQDGSQRQVFRCVEMK